MKITKQQLKELIKEQLETQQERNAFTPQELSFLESEGFEIKAKDVALKPLFGKLYISVQKLDKRHFIVDLIFDRRSLDFGFRDTKLEKAISKFYKGMKTGNIPTQSAQSLM